MNFDDRIFMKGVSGFAAASLGQLVEGYAVVFGREDGLNLREFEHSERCEFLRFARTARRRVEECFGPTVVFEHGPSCSGTNVSCGVNRIHLHIVPFCGSSLTEEIGRAFQCKATASTIEEILEKLSSWDAGLPYFWIEDTKGVSLFAYGEKRESQVVRRALAKLIGSEGKWNWREFPTHDEAVRVAQELSAGSAGQSLNQFEAVAT